MCYFGTRFSSASYCCTWVTFLTWDSASVMELEDVCIAGIPSCGDMKASTAQT